MAGFTFGRGNSRKLLGLPLYALSALVTLGIPRSKKLWVFGCGIGPGEGALPLYHAAHRRFGDQVRLVWMATTSAELELAHSLGLDAVRKTSLQGFWLTCRARVLVVTHGFGDVNRYGTRGGFVLQLWHGVPLKHLHLDSPSTYSVSFLPDRAVVRRLIGYAYRRAGRGLSMFAVAGQSVIPHIVTAFGVSSDRVIATGDIRDDVLLEGDEEVRRATGRRLLAEALPGLPVGSRTVLFAPTWRDGADDPTVPTDDEWRDIDRWLERHDAVLLVRTHPLGRGDFAAGPRASARVRMLGPDVLREINPVLWAVDAVVTDYSSLVFDYALVGGPVVFFAPDLEAYSITRGFYRSYDWFSDGRSVATWTEVLDRLQLALAEDDEGPAHLHARSIRDEVFDHTDGRAVDRVLDELLLRVDGLATPTPAFVGSVVSSTVDADSSSITIRLHSPVGPHRGRLVGTRVQIEVDLDRRGDQVDVTVPLTTTRWHSGPLALPSGTYHLELDGLRLMAGEEPIEAHVDHPLFRAQVDTEGSEISFEIRPPLSDVERSSAGQRRLERQYRRSSAALDDSMFFESFYGRHAACNPLGIDAAVAALRPHTRRYWSVVDGSVPVPDGAIAVVEGSAAWWQARATSKVLVVNDWLRKRYRRHGAQHVLQTWHGTTFKRLARDRPNATWRSRIAARREGNRWDALLAQNEFSAGHLRSAYAFSGPVWVDGYPRNDVLSHAERAATVRERLDLASDTRVVLYAPTWREDRLTMFDALDPTTVAQALGPNTVVLVRSHTRVEKHRISQPTPGVRDVTDYPDMADLMLVADVFVTDYSSAMFDWMSTGRPIIFFVPDLSRYRDELRGFYADLLAEPPGPVVQNVVDLIDELTHAEERAPLFAEVATRWRHTFTPFDDGTAGRRVVDRLVAEGWLV